MGLRLTAVTGTVPKAKVGSSPSIRRRVISCSVNSSTGMGGGGGGNSILLRRPNDKGEPTLLKSSILATGWSSDIFTTYLTRVGVFNFL